ncbi:putative f-box domain-containing protein [Erysiphe neolycopersici]|uniref:Putative f-box domain-containing protein n=1 Tax=Erysiphe neolycopersici TaxID=212602 RepID=A0A420I3N6_9PEZI|nr:putative f-box domain-containing protein [Erysiphe neolycopersici]
MDRLPPEVFLNLIEYLDPVDIAILQHVSRRFYILARDNVFWRQQCFTYSNYASSIRRREGFLSSLNNTSTTFLDQHLPEAPNNPEIHHQITKTPELNNSKEHVRILANWDPSYPMEKVDWYHEFIARNGPISLNWLEQPLSMMNSEKNYLEIKGMGILYDHEENIDSYDKRGWVVGPIEDGSVCLWDIRDPVSEREGNIGTIVARSRECLLSSDLGCEYYSNKHPNMTRTVATECVSVDSRTKRAYFAAENGKAANFFYVFYHILIYYYIGSSNFASIQCLIEIDLETFSKIRHEIFPLPISALSEARHPVPLTVGTTQSLHLFDTRAKFLSSMKECSSEHVDFYGYSVNYKPPKCIRSFNSPEQLKLGAFPNFAHLQGPGPLKIIHVPNFGTLDSDIYLAGRFPSILAYDRRKFPFLGWTIHSGARLSSMDWLPFSIVSEQRDLARYGKLSINQVEETKTQTGRTLIACGEYNSKGSLEMYGLSPTSNFSNKDLSYSGGYLHYPRKNRQTSSSSKLLAVANHGTRIVVSDGGGNLRWFERDGFTQSRCWNIAKNPAGLSRGVFGTQQALNINSGSEDIVIKILYTGSRGKQGTKSSPGDLIVWTGEKIGLVNFSSRSKIVTPEIEENADKMEAIYAERMRRALVANADEVRWMRDFGVGAPPLH